MVKVNQYNVVPAISGSMIERDRANVFGVGMLQTFGARRPTVLQGREREDRGAVLLKPYLGAAHSKALECPSDRDPLDAGQTFYAVEGCSYNWNYFLNGRLIDHAQVDLAALSVWPPIMGDYEKFHSSSGSGRNYLYPDGRAERDLNSLIQ